MSGAEQGNPIDATSSKKQVSKKPVFELAGQSHVAPPEKDPERIFYTSLLEQRPDSKLAKQWCVSRGLCSTQEAEEWVQLHQQQLKQKKLQTKDQSIARIRKNNTENGDQTKKNKITENRERPGKQSRTEKTIPDIQDKKISNKQNAKGDENLAADGANDGRGKKREKRKRKRARKHNEEWHKKERFHRQVVETRDVPFFDGGLSLDSGTDSSIRDAM